MLVPDLRDVSHKNYRIIRLVRKSTENQGWDGHVRESHMDRKPTELSVCFELLMLHTIQNYCTCSINHDMCVGTIIVVFAAVK